jgi:hypothetical protein
VPKTDPNKSPRTAVKHLFRHLNDAAELKRNPLVRRLIGEARQAKPPSDALMPSFVRSALRNAFASFRARRPSSRQETRFAREELIFENLLKGSYLYRQAAMQLGLSVQQYYRERQRLMDSVVASLATTEPIQRIELSDNIGDVRLGIAERRLQAGDIVRAGALASDIANSANSEFKVRALCIFAAAMCDRNDRVAATRALDDAEQILKQLKESRSAAFARCQIAFVRTRLLADSAKSIDAIGVALAALTNATTLGEPRSLSERATLVEALVECSEQYETLGDVRAARPLMNAALSASEQLPDFFPQKGRALRLGCRFEWFAEGNPMRLDAGRRIEAMRHAFSVTQLGGSVRDVVHSLIDLMAVSVSVGALKDTLVLARQVITLAQDSDLAPVWAYARLRVCDTLLATPHWLLGEKLLPQLAEQFTENSVNWLFCKVVESAYLEKLCRAEDSLLAALSAERGAVRQGQANILAAIHRLIASNAGTLGNDRLARERIEACLDIRKTLGGMNSQANAYRAAARITGKAEFDRRARDIARQIAY